MPLYCSSYTAFMDIAIKQAKGAEQAGEIPVGAVIITNGLVIAACGNSPVSSKDPTAHAEITVIRKASLALGTARLDSCQLIVTLEPCPMCAAAISLARIQTLVFGAYDPKTGGVEHGPRIFDHKTCHHKPQVIGGLKEKECGELLTNFFQENRKDKRGF